MVVGPGGGRATRPRAPAVRDGPSRPATRPARGVARGMRRAPFSYIHYIDGKHLPTATRHAGCWF